jgi:hypothetical protein
VTLATVARGDGRATLRFVVTEGVELAVVDRTRRPTMLGEMSRGEWHRVEIHARVGSRDGLVEVQLDGELLYRGNLRLGSAGIAAVQLGDESTDRTFDVAFDAVTVGESAPGSTLPTATQEPETVPSEPEPVADESAPSVNPEPSEGTEALEDTEMPADG